MNRHHENRKRWLARAAWVVLAVAGLATAGGITGCDESDLASYDTYRHLHEPYWDETSIDNGWFVDSWDFPDADIPRQ